MRTPRPVEGALAASLMLAVEGCALRSRREAQAQRQERRIVTALEGGDVGQAEAALGSALSAAELWHRSNPLALAEALDRFAEAFSADAVRSPKTLAIVESMRLRALELRQGTLPATDQRVGESLSNLSTAYYDQGRWDPAEEYERRALAAFESALGPGAPRVARSLRELATILFQEGRYREAAPLEDRALGILQGLDSAEPDAIARTLNVALEIRRVQGRYDEAEAAGRRGLDIARAGPEVDDVLVADLSNNLAGLYKDQGRYDEAEATYRDVMAIWKRDAEANAFNLSTAYLNQADIFRLQGRLDEAAPLFARALEMARHQLAVADPALATFLNRSALVLAEQGLYAEAEPLYRSALDLLDRTNPAHPDVAQTLHDLAGLRTTEGDLEDAQALYERAIAIREAAFGESHPEVALTLTESARCLHHAGPTRDQDALGLVDRAVAILSGTSVYPEALSKALSLQAEIRRSRGDAEGAITSMARSLAIVEDLRPRTGGSEATRADFIARYAGDFHHLASWLLEAGRISDALDYAERGRARVLLDQLALARLDLSLAIPVDVRVPLERRERDARAHLVEVQARFAFTEARADLEPTDRSALSARLSHELDAAAREVQQSASALRRASPLWRDLVTAGGRPAPLHQIRSELLVPDRLLLFYLVGPAESQLIVISGRGNAAYHTLRLEEEDARTLGVSAGPVSEERLDTILRGRDASGGIAAALGRSRGLARVPTTEEVEPTDLRLQALFRVLIPGPLWSTVREASEVLVVPDGALHTVPFEALVVEMSEGGPRYWLDAGPVVRYAPSATTACNLARRDPDDRAPIASSALVVANPTFDRTSGAAASALRTARTRQRMRALPGLPGTAREAAEIQAALQSSGTEVIVLSEAAAQESAVRAALAGQRRRFLHFATHGLVEEDRSELLAALALSAPEGQSDHPEDDGLLQLFEIYELDARSELAVLSACDSNRGRRITGEGVFALSRAFLAAGARRVVASLWPVDDSSTAALMGAYYRRVAAFDASGRIDYARALRDARRELRARPEWSNPYYWAPFIITGAP